MIEPPKSVHVLGWTCGRYRQTRRRGDKTYVYDNYWAAKKRGYASVYIGAVRLARILTGVTDPTEAEERLIRALTRRLRPLLRERNLPPYETDLGRSK